MRRNDLCALILAALAAGACGPDGGPTSPSAPGPVTPTGGSAAPDAGTPSEAGPSETPGGEGAESASGKWVTGYYVGYQQDIYPPSAIDFSGMSHLAVGRIVPNPDGSLNTGFDTHDGPALAKTLAVLAHKAGKKAILMLGGDGAHAAWVSAASAANRAKLVQNLVQALTTYGYDGYDLDWEPIDASDRPSFKALATELRRALPKAILTVPIGWNPDGAAFIAEVAPSFDQINIMSYSMADAWGGWDAWHSSALQGDGPTTPSSIDHSVNGYAKAGVPIAKLGIGIGFYGSCWVGGVQAPRASLANGSHVAFSDNEMSYTNIMSQYYVAANRKWDAAAKVPYLGFASPKGPHGCTFISYDDEESILAKGEYARAKGLGGAIVWTINQGYVPGKPGAQNPLLAATKKAFLDAKP